MKGKPFQRIPFCAIMIQMARQKSVKTEIPWELHMGIIKLQASNECTYNEACIHAVPLLDSNNILFKKAVNTEVSKKDRSSIMTRINKSKASWNEKGRQKGFTEGHTSGYQEAVQEYKIVYSCSVCSGELVMKPGAADHEAMTQIMKENGWAHQTCINKD